MRTVKVVLLTTLPPMSRSTWLTPAGYTVRLLGLRGGTFITVLPRVKAYSGVAAIRAPMRSRMVIENGIAAATWPSNLM
jgi:hypothetical protein